LAESRSRNSKIGVQEPPATALAVAFSSGKGGVGKTNIATNLGIALSEAHQRVCVLDADTSLANINILLGLEVEKNLDDYLQGSADLEDILLQGPKGLKIVPSATGITDYINMRPVQRKKMLTALEQLENQFDFILIDTAAGIGDGVIQFIESAQYAVIVITPEPTSLTDAFSLLKVLYRREYTQPVYILVNMANSYAHSMEVFKRFAFAVNKYLDKKVHYLGYVPTDQAVTQCVTKQIPLLIASPDSQAAKCIRLLANVLLKHFTKSQNPSRKISQFWNTQINKLPQSANNTEHEAANSPTTDIDPANVDTTKLSKQQADDLFSDLIKHYLTEFGSLPEQAIDLVIQAFEQDQLPAKAKETLQTHWKDAAPSESERELPAMSKAQNIQDGIDDLVGTAQQTKQQLTELAEHLRVQYRELYNADLARTIPKMRAVPSPAHHPIGNEADETDGNASLKSSIRFAAAVDLKD